MKNLAVRTGTLKRGRYAKALSTALKVFDVFRGEDAFVVVDEVAVADWRLDLTDA